MPDSWIWNPSIECMNKNDLAELQLKRLKMQVHRLFSTAGYYRRKMKELGVSPDDIKSLDDLKKLPFTTKDDLRELQPFDHMVVSLEEVVEVHGTSGTTGEPVFMYYTARDIENWSEVMARSLASAGLTKKDILQITPSFSLFTGGFGFFYGARKIGAFIVPTGPGFSRRQIYVMMKLGTTMIAGVANYALRLAEVAYEMGIDPAKDTKVRKGVFGAEMWSDSLRKKIEKIWDMETFDIYGMAELYGPGTAIDCQYHSGLHVWEDHNTKTCSCGRTHIKIDRIQGRTDDMFIINGVNIWPSAIETVLFKYPLIGNEYQIIVKKTNGGDKLLIKVESIRNLTEQEKEVLSKKLQYEIKETILVTPDIEIVDPNTLPRSEGKAKRLYIIEES
ncbi:MAG: AMP-binding protein [Ignisphaera sp.]